jgi:hypothetical protein
MQQSKAGIKREKKYIQICKREQWRERERKRKRKREREMGREAQSYLFC